MRVNGDVTGNAPRFGYFWALDSGNVGLANRKPGKPDDVVAKILASFTQVWELSRIGDANKFELRVVNVASVEAATRKARLHNDA